jgi:hypothetical protein
VDPRWEPDSKTGWPTDRLIVGRNMTLIFTLRVIESCSCDKREAGKCGSGEKGMLAVEAATKQRLMRTEKTARVIVIFGVCNSVRFS